MTCNIMNIPSDTDRDQAAALPQSHGFLNIPMPPNLAMRGNISQIWKKWRQVWDSYEVTAHLKTQQDTYRVAAFIMCIGPDALDIYSGLPFESPEDKNNINRVLELMEPHCIGETNIIY